MTKRDYSALIAQLLAMAQQMRRTHPESPGAIGYLENAAVAIDALCRDLEKLVLQAEADTPHNCHTCAFRRDRICPGNRSRGFFGYQNNCPQWKWRGPREINIEE